MSETITIKRILVSGEEYTTNLTNDELREASEVYNFKRLCQDIESRIGGEITCGTFPLSKEEMEGIDKLCFDEFVKAVAKRAEQKWDSDQSHWDNCDSALEYIINEGGISILVGAGE